jgi:hypothetical protein
MLNNNQLININVSCCGSHLGFMIDTNISRSTTKEHFSQVCCSVVKKEVLVIFMTRIRSQTINHVLVSVGTNISIATRKNMVDMP